jgi:hypothetical protein
LVDDEGGDEDELALAVLGAATVFAGGGITLPGTWLCATTGLLGLLAVVSWMGAATRNT